MKARNDTAQKLTPSNLMRLSRAFRTLVLSIAAFWIMPGSARAQLYVGDTVSIGNFGVSTFDAATGAAINSNFVPDKLCRHSQCRATCSSWRTLPMAGSR
jgi:hypothetical protein